MIRLGHGPMLHVNNTLEVKAMYNDYGQKPGLAPLFAVTIDDDHVMTYLRISDSWLLRDMSYNTVAEISANAFKTIAEFRTWAESKL